ncbi:MAG: hypothetical protein QM724_03290 [Flavobacteriales bacterium]
MNGKHSLDDLFARGLRDAEAAPPGAVWEGVVRRRGRAHRILQRLRRNWGYGLTALLLIGAGTAFWTSYTSGPGHTAEAVPSSGTAIPGRERASTTEEPRAVPEGPTEASGTTSPGGVPVPPPNAAATPGTPAPILPEQAPAPGITRSSAQRTDARTPEHAERSASSTSASSPRTVAVGHTADAYGAASSATRRSSIDTRNTNAPDPSAASTPVSAPSSVASVPRSGADASLAGSDHAPAWEGASVLRPNGQDRAVQEPARMVGLLRDRPAPAPATITTPPYVRPKGDRWVAVQSGYYQEERVWNGSDKALVKALGHTETPHYPWSIGVAAGRTFRSGWGLSVGAEYLGARYRFLHEDRIVQRTETVTRYLVTLNTDIFSSRMDTLVSISEDRRTSSAINTYSVVRVPVELSYHRPWKRWRYGVQAGVAAEFVRMRSGLTLSTSPEGSEYAVDLASEDQKQRSNTLLTGSIGLDLGYLINDRIGLWATPTYMRGLSPLTTGDAAYAMPDRWGVRFRLAYTFPHR